MITWKDYVNTYVVIYTKDIKFLSSVINRYGIEFRIAAIKKHDYPFRNEDKNIELVVLDARNNRTLDDDLCRYHANINRPAYINAIYGIIENQEPERLQVSMLATFGIHVVKVFREFVRIMEQRPIDATCYEFALTWYHEESKEAYEKWLTNYVLQRYIGLDKDVIRTLKKRG